MQEGSLFCTLSPAFIVCRFLDDGHSDWLRWYLIIVLICISLIMSHVEHLFMCLLATTPVFSPGESHGQRNLVGYSPWGWKRVRRNLVTEQGATEQDQPTSVDFWGEVWFGAWLCICANKPLHSFCLCCWSVAQSCQTLCDPMDCSMPGFPVLHHLLEFAQTYVLWVSDSIQPSHPLLSLSPFAIYLSQHQGLLQWVGTLHPVAKVLELQHQSFQWIFCVDFL